MTELFTQEKELRKFIIKTVSEMTERIVPMISEDEEFEIQSLHGSKIYDDDYDENDCIRI